VDNPTIQPRKLKSPRTESRPGAGGTCAWDERLAAQKGRRLSITRWYAHVACERASAGEAVCKHCPQLTLWP